jgi:hypothetical protein
MIEDWLLIRLKGRRGCWLLVEWDCLLVDHWNESVSEEFGRVDWQGTGVRILSVRVTVKQSLLQKHCIR